MKIGQTVYAKMGLKGIVKSIEGSKVVVDCNGVEKIILKFLLKTKPITKKRKVYAHHSVAKVTNNFNSIKNQIQGSLQDRGSYFSSLEIYSKIEKLADSKGHFVGDIISGARIGKFVSEKQSIAVASFAKSNNLI